jgi:teichuronic acid biosynthesis glycosyltransferase TuaC
VPHAEMPDYYRAADCLLLTSDQEGSPNVVKEALCCDLPVVSVEVGDVRRWVELVPGSVLVDRDPEAIAAGLDQVLGNGRTVDGTGIRRELSAERTARRLIEIYREALEGRA